MRVVFLDSLGLCSVKRGRCVGSEDGNGIVEVNCSRNWMITKIAMTGISKLIIGKIWIIDVLEYYEDGGMCPR